ncbi:unnamed protein product [Effrenium voratum]|uniref:Uncharacterized protein n=1 Tax=Effrenium voratum TaxID=2562239 RepID=A0AA36JKP2_9DINO|nr:unnamed protein product [Effrenium voratum]
MGGRPVFGSLGHNSAAAPAANFEIIERYPHRTDCFTEGLSVNGTDPEVFESCGLTGRSYVRRYDLRSGATKQQVGLEAKYFGEGAVLHGESLLASPPLREFGSGLAQGVFVLGV